MSVVPLPALTTFSSKRSLKKARFDWKELWWQHCLWWGRCWTFAACSSPHPFS